MIELFHKDEHTASFLQDSKKYALNYHTNNLKNSISLSLPNTKKLYVWDYRFPPFLETFLPEGYLYEIFKNLLSKEYGEINDYLVFSFLASNIENRIAFKSDTQILEFPPLDIEEILNNDTEDTFNHLLKLFLNKNAISGVQPKTLAVIKDKESLNLKEYIVKTWGSEFPCLAENEYFCLKAVENAGVPIPNVSLSKNKNFLLVEKFLYKDDGTMWGFEEILSLMDKNRDKKYSGSYESVAKVIYAFCTDKKESMKNFFKTVVMNYLLKNGDAHLKNFGLLFSDDFKEIKFSPAYDVVNTVVYIHKDKPALTLNGKKVWFSKKELLKFGQKSCLLSKKDSEVYYKECLDSLKLSIKELKLYIEKNKKFFSIGNKILDSWKLSLKEEDIKEIDDELIRSWKNY